MPLSCLTVPATSGGRATMARRFLSVPETGLVGVVMSQNEPGEFSGLPVEIFIVQGIAFAGL